MPEYEYFDFPSFFEAMPTQRAICREHRTAIVHIESETINGITIPEEYIAYRGGFCLGWPSTLRAAEQLIEQEESKPPA